MDVPPPESDSQNRFGQEFEEEVKAFLSDTLHFHDVMGGQGFHIAPEGGKNQIDACGRFEDVLFIFDCKAAGRRVKKNLRKDILESQTRARMVWENYKKIPEYADCTMVRYIFITKKIEIPETEKDLLYGMRQPSVFYADETLLEYYSDLEDKIGQYAVFNFLADFDIHPAPGDELKVPAMKTNLGGNTVYTFYANPKQLLKFAYVARRRSNNEDFYQRMLDKSRINRIKTFLDSGGVFPTNIILSLKGGDKFFEPIQTFESSPATQVGVLTIKNSYQACWIVDGQHRLYSYAESTSEVPLACLAFDSIDIESQRRFFLEINKEQRPIQPDLIWDLEGLSNETTTRGVISNAIRTLDSKEDTPFFHKIYIPVRGSRTGKIVNMAAFCNGIVNAGIARQTTTNCYGINPLYDSEFTQHPGRMTKRIADVLGRYFSLLDEKLADDHKAFIFGNAGIPIMLYLLEPIVARIGHVPNYGDLQSYTTKIADYLLANYSDVVSVRALRQESNSEGARKNIAKQIGLYIRRESRDYQFWPKMEQDDSVQEIIDMERRLANLISTQLSGLNSNWKFQYVPQDIRKVAMKRSQQDGTSFEENLDLGDLLKIISITDNWANVFKSIFISKEGFLSIEELGIAFNYLFKIRNPGAHGKTVTYSKEDLAQCELYLAKLSRVVPDLLEIDDSTISETTE